MARLIAMYSPPADKGKFDAYYFGKHIPLAKTLPGLRKYEVNASPVMTVDNTSPYHLVAVLHFDDLAALRAATQSDAGKATAADLANFAQAGVQVVFFEDKIV